MRSYPPGRVRALGLAALSGMLLMSACSQPALQTSPTSGPAASAPTTAAAPTTAGAAPTAAVAAPATTSAAPTTAAVPTTAAAATTPAAAPTTASAAPTTAASTQALSGSVAVDGSSTVFPITEAVGEEFQKEHPDVRVTVGVSGTGGGFKRFCAGETDISDASRPIKQEEAEVCKTNGVEFVELPVAYDGLSVMVNPGNTFLDCIKKSELKKIWEPGAQGTVSKWNQVNPEWPDQEFKLYGPGTDSGTFDYFTDEINGEEGASRGDFTASEDDNVLVQGIAGDPNALGYFGYAYYVENKDSLKLLKVDNEDGAGCIEPTPQTIETGTYKPLSRPIFIYASTKALGRPELREFVNYYMANAATLTAEVGYIPLPADIYAAIAARVAAGTTGTVYDDAAEGKTLQELYGA